MQKLIAEKNKEFYEKLFEFEYEGIYVKMTGKKAIVRIKIKKSLLSADQQEQVQDSLQVVLNRAVNGVEAKYKEEIESKLGPLASSAPTNLI